VALSTAEAEYISLALGTQDALWGRTLLREIGLPQNLPTLLHEDNNSTMEMANKHKVNQRTKHIDVKFYFIHEDIKHKYIELIRYPSTEQLADLLTKGIPDKQLIYLLNLIGLQAST